MYAFMPAPRSSRLAASLLLATVPLAAGHAYLSLPQSRNFVKNDKNGYMPQSGNGAGICGDGGQWPADSDFVNYLGGPQTTYVAGSTVVFEVTITAHHKGHFEFRVCDQEITSALADADACLDKWVLERVDPEITYGPNDCLPNDERGDCQPLDTSHPERFYLPPPAAGVGQNWSESVAGVQVERMHYTIPKNLTCTKCTLQWQWWTANSCIPKPGYGCYFASMGVQGWNAHQWCGSYCGECPGSDGVPGCGEEFRNCADLTILPVGSPVPVPTPPPTPAPRDCGTAVGGPCAACLATNNVCYDQSQAWCSQMRYQWCGAGADSTPAPAAPSPAPAPATPAPTPSPAAPTPAPPPATPAPTPAPVPLPGPLDCGAAHGGPCAACLATNYVCYDESEDWCDWMRYQWCGVGGTPAPPTPAPGARPPECGSCAQCLANNGVCYANAKSWCDLYPQYTWCGAALVQAQVQPHSHGLPARRLRGRPRRSRKHGAGADEEDESAMLQQETYFEESEDGEEDEEL